MSSRSIRIVMVYFHRIIILTIRDKPRIDWLEAHAVVALVRLAEIECAGEDLCRDAGGEGIAAQHALLGDTAEASAVEALSRENTVSPRTKRWRRNRFFWFL